MAEVLLGPDKLQMEAVREVLGEDENRLRNNLRLFEKWIECNAHLPQNYDKNNLPIFLRGCKHDLQKAQKKFELYYTVKNYIADIFGREPRSQQIGEFVSAIHIAVLPKLTPQGQRVTIFRIADPDAHKFSIRDAIAYLSMIYDIRFSEETPHAGEVFVFDGTHFTTAHAAKFVNVLIKKYLALTRKSYPIRIQQVHVLHAPAFAAKVVHVLRPHIHHGVRDRIVFHEHSDTLLDYVPEDILPADFGGSEESTRAVAERWYKTVVKRAEWFEEQAAVKCEGPVPQSVYQACALDDSNFGVSGSFRRLQID